MKSLSVATTVQWNEPTTPQYCICLKLVTKVKRMEMDCHSVSGNTQNTNCLEEIKGPWSQAVTQNTKGLLIHEYKEAKDKR